MIYKHHPAFVTFNLGAGALLLGSYTDTEMFFSDGGLKKTYYSEVGIGLDGETLCVWKVDDLYKK